MREYRKARGAARCAAALERRWNWRGLFLSGFMAPGCACIAITRDTVRPVQGAAIVEAENDEHSARSRPILYAMLNTLTQSFPAAPCARAAQAVREVREIT